MYELVTEISTNKVHLCLETMQNQNGFYIGLYVDSIILLQSTSVPINILILQVSSLSFAVKPSIRQIFVKLLPISSFQYIFFEPLN